MRYIALLFILSIISIFTYSQNVPTLNEVVTEFYRRYTFESFETYLRFEKKKEGWYVAEDKYTAPGNHLNPTLFWSGIKNTYVNIAYPLANKDTALISKHLKDYMQTIDWNYEERQFKIHKYYGYSSWAWDIINESNDQRKLTDSNWESLARAYSTYASGFIAEQYGDIFENNDEDRRPLKPNAAISKARIEKFIYYEKKAIEAYKNILSMNPAYQTMVGNIKIKYANEHLFSYCELLLANDSINARNFITQATYPDSLIELYKPCLDSLPLNSILITGGDNDTYTLWYIQEVMNYRKDVIVLNATLLGFRRYLFINDKKYKGKLFSTADSIYLKENFEYFLYSSNKKDLTKINISNFISDLNNAKNPYDTTNTHYKEEPLKTYYVKELFFTPLKSKVNFGSQISISKLITLKDYIYMNDFMLLDIINTNLGKRKIFFTYQNEFLSEILDLKDSVYEIAPYKN